MKNRIKAAVKKLNLENQKLFTYAELQAIAREAKADVLDVMFYLRFQR